MLSVLLCCAAALGADDEFLAWTPAPASVSTLPETTGRRLRESELADLANTGPTLPFGDVTCGVRADDGATWVGSRRGLMCLEPGASRWRVFHSRRWLPDDDVENLALLASGDVVVQTAAGLGKLALKPTTLEKKMHQIDDTLVAHHRREGLVGSIRVNEPGDLGSGYHQPHNDNDGLWTCIYIAAEAFRYGVTGEEEAKRNARRSLEALMFLEEVTGIPGFAARSIWPITEPKPQHGEWHRADDGKWWWKGDTSSDEIDGHYFAYSIYYNVAADEEEKKEIARYVARITDHIIEHGYNYVGPPGKPTTWGVWAPDKLNHDLRRQGDRGLNSLEILSFLKVAEHICGNPRYVEAQRELIEQHAYAANTLFQKHAWPTEWVNHSDDELAFLAYYPLLVHERDPELRRFYLASIRRTWRAEQPERSPLFNLIYGTALQASEWTDPTARPEAALVEPERYDRDVCLQWFRDVPADTFEWTIRNSGRNDLGGLATNRFGDLTSKIVLPVSERRVMRWNGDPYEVDGGRGGRSRDDGAAILLPYWMGRYHRLID
ncbi:MAG: hypothetical protein DWQ37_01415 [Planctomycetota bacterium]|nr:MAG: hypothetical protein DWQ37_01415 [Planctomycetota bacterium]